MDSEASQFSESALLDQYQGQDDPFLTLLDPSMDYQLRMEYPVYPKKKSVYPFTQYILYSIEAPGGPDWEHYICNFIVFATKIGLIGIPVGITFKDDVGSSSIDSTLLGNTKISLKENMGVYIYQTTHAAGPVIDWNAVVKDFCEKFSIFLVSPVDSIVVGNYNTAWMNQIMAYGVTNLDCSGSYGFHYPNSNDKIRVHIAYLQSMFMDRSNPSVPIIGFNQPEEESVVLGPQSDSFPLTPDSKFIPYKSINNFQTRVGFKHIQTNGWFTLIPQFCEKAEEMTNYLYYNVPDMIDMCIIITFERPQGTGFAQTVQTWVNTVTGGVLNNKVAIIWPLILTEYKIARPYSPPAILKDRDALNKFIEGLASRRVYQTAWPPFSQELIGQMTGFTTQTQVVRQMGYLGSNILSQIFGIAAQAIMGLSGTMNVGSNPSTGINDSPPSEVEEIEARFGGRQYGY